MRELILKLVGKPIPPPEKRQIIKGEEKDLTMGEIVFARKLIETLKN